MPLHCLSASVAAARGHATPLLPSPSLRRLNNLNGVGVARTIGNKTYYVHRGMSSEYYSTIRGPLMEQLRRIAASQQLISRVKSITFNGQQGGGRVW